MRVLSCLLVLILLVLPTSAADLTGTYKGTWSGNSGDGDFVITIDTHDSANPKAQISFTVSGEDVKTTVASVSVNGSKVKLVSKFEVDGMDLQSTMTGELQGKTLQGTYETTSQADGSEVDSGTWKTTAQ